MELIQGSTYYLEFQLKDNGVIIDNNKVETVQFVLGTVDKRYPDRGVSYNAEKQKYIIDLTQQDTMVLEGKVLQQIRVKYKDGQVKSSKATSVNVYNSITEAIL